MPRHNFRLYLGCTRGVFAGFACCWCCLCGGNDKKFDAFWDRAFGDVDVKVQRYTNPELESQKKKEDIEYLGFDPANNSSLRKYLKENSSLSLLESHGHLFKLLFCPSGITRMIIIPYRNKDKAITYFLYDLNTGKPLGDEAYALKQAIAICKTYIDRVNFSEITPLLE